MSRGKGWLMPPGCVVVSRPSKWGNPFVMGTSAARTRAEAVARFREALLAGHLPFRLADVRRELAGKPLACWCPLDEPCHADVLIEVAND